MQNDAGMVDTVGAFMSVFADCCHSQELGPEGMRGEAQGSTHSLTSSLPTQQRMGPRCEPPGAPLSPAGLQPDPRFQSFPMPKRTQLSKGGRKEGKKGRGRRAHKRMEGLGEEESRHWWGRGNQTGGNKMSN